MYESLISKCGRLDFDEPTIMHLDETTYKASYAVIEYNYSNEVSS